MREGHGQDFLCGRTEEFCLASTCLSGPTAVGIRGHKGENNCKLTTWPWNGGKEWNGFDRALRNFLEAEDHTRDLPFPTSSCTSQAEPLTLQALGHLWPSLFGRVLPGKDGPTWDL